ncbi:MAG: DEAD/DEAH box helicase [Phycisphaerae bacterium]|jgi:superfamily II DNA/RNA helicase|nr:DEAD/DEAH box helicase [Phycisphaerae bacterium]MCZ2399747.1 DEAD/DEAH box helicase [Phycisphaerae bacterium]
MSSSELLNGETPSETQSSFAALGLNTVLANAAERMRLERPTDVQTKLVPAMLAGRDCLVLARSGSGKTNAYLLPLAQKIAPGEGMQALILAPHRELARQIARALHRFERECRLRPAIVVPGRPERMPGAAPPEEADLVIGTPAAVCEAVERRRLDLSALRYVVVDEADAQLEGDKRGALQDAMRRIPGKPHVVILAGRLEGPVREFADEFAPGAETLDVPKPESPLLSLPQHFVALPASVSRAAAVAAFVAAESPRMVFLFSQSDGCVAELQRWLRPVGAECSLLDTPTNRRGPRDDRGHGRGPARPASVVVVVTDPTPRKVGSLPFSHALHFDVPADPGVYAARLEECVRVSRGGYSLALVSADDQEALERIRERHQVEISQIRPAWLSRPPAEPPTEPAPQRQAGRPSPGGAPRPGRPAEGRRGRDESPRPRETATRDASRPPAPRSPQRPPAPAPAPAPASNNGPTVPARLREALRRDPELDARGVPLVKRTLGARFKPARGRRLAQPPLPE